MPACMETWPACCRSGEGWLKPCPKYLTALQLNPSDAAVHEALAQLFLKQGQTEQALASLNAALKLQPTASAHTLLAYLRQRQGDVADAVRHYFEALRLKPDSPAILNNLAWILATWPDAGIRNGAQAVELAKKPARKRPSNKRSSLAPWRRLMPKRAGLTGRWPPRKRPATWPPNRASRHCCKKTRNFWNCTARGAHSTNPQEQAKRRGRFHRSIPTRAPRNRKPLSLTPSASCLNSQRCKSETVDAKNGTTDY